MGHKISGQARKEGKITMYGFYGKILKIDLTTSSHCVETVPEDVYKTYLGGKGLATWLLYQNAPARVDPLSPENPIIFATGPVGQSPVWGSSRYGVYTKSPQTGFYSESYSGGKTPEAVDAAGYDAVVITGRADAPTPKPQTLKINIDRVWLNRLK